MAIPYLRLTPVKKAGTTLGRAAHHGGHRLSHGAAGKSAYLSGSKHVSKDGMVTDYRRKHGIEHSALVLPGGGTTDRERFWNAVDAHKTQRETATIARDMIVAFPHEFSLAERKEAAHALATWICERYKVAVDYGMHEPETHKGSSEKNYHAHFLISERTVSEKGDLGKVQRELNQAVQTRIDKSRGRLERKEKPAVEIKRAWANIANGILERGGHTERVDFTTPENPGKHMGPEATRQQRQQGMTPTQVREKLAGFSREIERRISEITERIAEIKRQRQMDDAALVGSYLGSLDRWQNDAMQTFLDTMKSADRAERLRSRLKEHSRPRAATPEEHAELKRLGQELHRHAKLQASVMRAARSAAELDPGVRIKVQESCLIKRTVRRIEREIAKHRDKGMEMAA